MMEQGRFDLSRSFAAAYSEASRRLGNAEASKAEEQTRLDDLRATERDMSAIERQQAPLVAPPPVPELLRIAGTSKRIRLDAEGIEELKRVSSAKRSLLTVAIIDRR